MSRKEQKRIDKFIDNKAVRARRKQDKEFRSLYKLAIKTIRRLKATKATKETYLKDLLECNNIEIMHYLGQITPKSEAEYIEAINKLLEMESIEHEYPAKMVYKVGQEAKRERIDTLSCFTGGFRVITEHIRNMHRYVDLKEKITSKKA